MWGTMGRRKRETTPILFSYHHPPHAIIIIIIIIIITAIFIMKYTAEPSAEEPRGLSLKYSHVHMKLATLCTQIQGSLIIF